MLIAASPAWSMEQYKIPWFKSRACNAYLKISREPHSCYIASQNGFYELIRRNCIDLTSKDEYDSSLAHAAAISDRPDILKLLHAKGIPCDSTNKPGKTPLHMAIKFASIKTIETLLAYGADITKKAKDTNKTILHFAAQQNNTDILAWALKKAQSHNIDVNGRDIFGNTPLHTAASSGIAPNISVLLKYGADPFALNKQGQTPVSCAIEQNHKPEAIFILACAVAEKAYIRNKTQTP